MPAEMVVKNMCRHFHEQGTIFHVVFVRGTIFHVVFVRGLDRVMSGWYDWIIFFFAVLRTDDFIGLDDGQTDKF